MWQRLKINFSITLNVALSSLKKICCYAQQRKSTISHHTLVVEYIYIYIYRYIHFKLWLFFNENKKNMCQKKKKKNTYIP